MCEALQTDHPDVESFRHYADKTAHATQWSRGQAHFVYQIPRQEDVCVYIDLNTLEAFRVEQGTNNLTEQEIIDHWDQVEAADRAEITQFVHEHVWKCMKSSDIASPS